MSQLEARQESQKRRQDFIRSMRHGKFGFQTQIMRDDGSLVTNYNIYQQNIDVNDISKF